MHPVRFKIIDKEHNAACAPGYGVRPKDGFNYRKRLYGKGDICNAKYAPTGKHGKHGHSGAARAAHNGGNAVGAQIGQAVLNSEAAYNVPALAGAPITAGAVALLALYALRFESQYHKKAVTPRA